MDSRARANPSTARRTSATSPRNCSNAACGSSPALPLLRSLSSSIILSLPAHSAPHAYPSIPRQLPAKVAAVTAAPAVHADPKPPLAGALTQAHFHMGLPLKALRHAPHFLPTP